MQTENTNETTYAILKPNEIKTVGTVAKAVKENTEINQAKIEKIMDAHKKDHKDASADIYLAAKVAGFDGANQTLKNWVYEWRKANGLTAKPDGTDKGGNKNKGKGNAIKALKDLVNGDWVDGEKTQQALCLGYAVMVEAKAAEYGEYTEGQEEECVYGIGEQAALAWSRTLKEKRLALKAKREKLSNKDKKEIDDTLKNVTKKATGKRTEKVSA